MVPVGQVAEDGDGHRAGADLHVGQGALARADAVEPVAMVARAISRGGLPWRSAGPSTMEAGSLLRWSRSIRRVPLVPVKVQPLGPPWTMTTPLA